MDIITKLDQLAEYQAQVDYLALKKQELIDAVKIPAEVLAAQDAANKARQAVDSEVQCQVAEITRAKLDELEEVEVPEEIRAAYAAIAEHRRQIEEEAAIRVQARYQHAQQIKAEIDASLIGDVQRVYAEVAQRKAEISAEFDSKAEGAQENIAQLTAEIKTDVIREGQTVKGQYYQAVYVKGRVSWITDMLEGMIIAFPALEKARKVGAPSVTLRKVGA